MKLLTSFALAFMALTQISLAKEIPNSKADSVSVTLYYEALCGGCHDWITTELVSTYEKLGQYIDFEFVPYGNAHQQPDGDSWKFECQHGPSECVGNIQQSCIVAHPNGPMNEPLDTDTQIRVISCIEESGDVSNEQTVRDCLLSSGVSTKITDDIIACSNDEEGIQLHHEMGVKTDALNPPHSYVPWVTFNGEHDVNFFCPDELFTCLCYYYLQDVPECAQKKTELSYADRY